MFVCKFTGLYSKYYSLWILSFFESCFAIDSTNLTVIPSVASLFWYQPAYSFIILFEEKRLNRFPLVWIHNEDSLPMVKNCQYVKRSGIRRQRLLLSAHHYMVFVKLQAHHYGMITKQLSYEQHSPSFISDLTTISILQWSEYILKS